MSVFKPRKPKGGWTPDAIKALNRRRDRTGRIMMTLMGIAAIVALVCVASPLTAMVALPIIGAVSSWPIFMVDLGNRRIIYLRHVSRRRRVFEGAGFAGGWIGVGGGLFLIGRFVSVDLAGVLVYLLITVSPLFLWLLMRRFEKRKPMSAVMAEFKTDEPEDEPPDTPDLPAVVGRLSPETREFLGAMASTQPGFFFKVAQLLPGNVADELVAADLASRDKRGRLILNGLAVNATVIALNYTG